MVEWPKEFMRTAMVLIEEKENTTDCDDLVPLYADDLKKQKRLKCYETGC